MSDTENKLIPNPFAGHEEADEAQLPEASYMIYQGIAKDLRENPRDNNINRASSAPQCVRQRWYTKNGFAGEPMQPRAILNFALGDVSELVLVHYIQKYLVGPDKFYSEVNFGDAEATLDINGKVVTKYSQKTLHWKINDDITVTAHLDGLGKRNSDGKWEIIEIKSASDYGFDDFAYDGKTNYLEQAHACMMTGEMKLLGVDSIRYFYQNKNIGKIHDRLYKFDQSIADRVKKEFIAASGMEIPDRPYGFIEQRFRGKPTGEQILSYPCSYCPYVSTCQPDAERVWLGTTTKKPIWRKRK